MSMVSEQVKRLRDMAYRYWFEDVIRNELISAADTIEALTAKQQEENMELYAEHDKESGSHEKMMLNEAIKHCEEKTNCIQCGQEHKQLAEWLKELAQYKDLEKQRKLMKLPCEVGDVIWDNDSGRPRAYEVTGFSFGNLNDECMEEEMILDQVIVYYTNASGSITGNFAVSEIGKTVFFTREEARIALEEL